MNFKNSFEKILNNNNVYMESPNNNKKNKQFQSLLKKEFGTSYTAKDVQNVECLDSLEGAGGIAWVLFNNRFKELPSLIYIDTSKYNMKLLDFLKDNGTVEYRKLYNSNDYSEAVYVILYENCYYAITITFNNQDKFIIPGFSIYHSIYNTPNLKQFTKFEETQNVNPKIGIIKTTRYGPAVTWVDHNTDLKFDYNNYNEDFLDFFDDLKEKLSGPTKTGLYLFYGEAGTGKSSAIRHLISQVERPVVFIPPQMINCLSSPDFTDLVTGTLKGSILVIEDAEKALMKRETEDGFFNSELVSSILNLTDGLYADISQTSIIATYNCHRNLVDPALLRKGRLRSEYHFEKLSIDKSKNLMHNLGHEMEIQETMTLADIFNYTKQYSNKKEIKKRTVGFGG